MTNVKLFYQDGHITQVEAEGHTGFAKSGKDIVCAAVSTILQSTLMGLISVAQAKTETTSNDNGYLRFRVLEHDVHKRYQADIILMTMRIAILDIQQGYPKHVKLEEIKDVY